MAVYNTLKRYFLIIATLAKHPASYEELENELRQTVEIDGDPTFFSLRTFQRDIKAIRKLFDINIMFDRDAKKYKIDRTEQNNDFLLHYFGLMSTIKKLRPYHKHIIPDTYPAISSQNILDTLKAIQNRNIIRIWYRKFDGEIDETPRTVFPLLVKEFNRRWYLLAEEKGIKKFFGFERIVGMEITKQRFKPEKNFEPEKFLNKYFGVVIPENEKAQDIELEIDCSQRGYFETMPLHKTQQISKCEDDTFRLTATIVITFDLIMELMRYGGLLKVIKPQSLAKTIKEYHKQAYLQYEK